MSPDPFIGSIFSADYANWRQTLEVLFSALNLVFRFDGVTLICQGSFDASAWAEIEYRMPAKERGKRQLNEQDVEKHSVTK
jgi:hypothetical protein